MPDAVPSPPRPGLRPAGRAGPALLLGLLLALAACSSPDLRPDQLVPPLTADDQLAYEGVAVIAGTQGGESSSGWRGSRIDGETFHAALVETMVRTGIDVAVGPDGEGDHVLFSEILWQDQPRAGLDMRVGLCVRYTVARTLDGERIWTRDIVTNASGTLEDAWSGARRLAIANEKVVRLNLERLVEALAVQVHSALDE